MLVFNVLADIFQLSSEVDYSKYKYIYFESIYDTEGRGIGEIDILLKFAEKVGRENILVKKHPRSTNFVFEENGIAVDTNSAAPFEAIQLNHDMSHAVFVSAMSGSVLSVNSIVDSPSAVRLIYSLTESEKYEDKKKFVENVKGIVEQFQNAGKLQHIKTVHCFEELYE